MSFNESVFLQKAKVMYKVVNNNAPKYVTDLFHLRGNNSNDTTSNLRSVFNRNFLILKLNKPITSQTYTLLSQSNPASLPNKIFPSQKGLGTTLTPTPRHAQCAELSLQLAGIKKPNQAQLPVLLCRAVRFPAC